MIPNKVVLDPNGIDKLLHSKEVKAGLRVIAEDLKDAAARELRSHVKHDEPPTLPIMAESFYVEETKDGYNVSNHDPDYALIELGTHPGGGDTYVKYAPLRRALDQRSGQHGK